MALCWILGLLLVLCQSYPLLKAKGSHLEVGQQIGTTFKDRIVDFLHSNSDLHGKLLPFYQTSAGKKLFARLYEINCHNYPGYCDEIRGMAEGAGVVLTDLLLLNFAAEILPVINQTVNNGTVELQYTHCSDLHVSGSSAFLAHNEDASITIKDTGYFVEYHVSDNGSEQKFTAFTYPGYLSGNAFGFNSKLVISTNAVFPKDIQVGIARTFINRDIYTAQTFDDAISKATPQNRGSGFSLNLGSLSERRTINVEVGPKTYAVTTVPTGGNFSHFNMYKVLNIPQYDDPSTTHRQARVNQLPAPKLSAQIQSLLGDTTDPQYPIYRNGNPPDDVATVATIIFDLTTHIAHVWDKNPSKFPPSHRFDLNK